ncbi:endogenous retrovirus group K member 25 Env polyprotein-like [Rousettus aegyptiacus]|uniref:endogenous retrovirus group K member 25 Env polyprotein-like n=1 Tax=Rousettus aegyptiacus TaxID=9407 RepID=UPI00168D3BAC|nr:endogenous retrovirus group K member 25 Env polyprotein-like [Rousettus aegyptiacus]
MPNMGPEEEGAELCWKPKGEQSSFGSQPRTSGSGSREKRQVVSESGQEISPTSLFLAMTALITAQVSGVQAETGNYSYWAYVPNTPLNKAVGWGDASVIVHVNDSNWMPGPHGTRGPLRPEEEGRVIENYMVGTKGMPICMGAGEHCLQLGAQAWLTTLQTSEQNAGVGHLFLLSMVGFNNVTEPVSDTSPPDLPGCATPKVQMLELWVQWNRCQAEQARVSVNTSRGRVIDWSPSGFARAKAGKVNLRWH